MLHPATDNTGALNGRPWHAANAPERWVLRRSPGSRQTLPRGRCLVRKVLRGRPTAIIAALRYSVWTVWLCVGDVEKAAALVGLNAAERTGGEADMDAVARWLDDGIAPNGARGQTFTARSTHGFDLTFCAPKSVSILRALTRDDVIAQALLDAHNTAVRQAMEYLTRP
jgi:hypothetical protein